MDDEDMRLIRSQQVVFIGHPFVPEAIAVPLDCRVLQAEVLDTKGISESRSRLPRIGRIFCQRLKQIGRAREKVIEAVRHGHPI